MLRQDKVRQDCPFFVWSYKETCWCVWQPQGAPVADNTKRTTEGWRARGPCCQMKNMNFLRTGELHTKEGWQVAPQDGPVGCGNGRAGGLPFSAACPAVFRSPPDCLFVQSAGPPFCFLCSLAKVHVFDLETRPSSPLMLSLEDLLNLLRVWTAL